MIAIICFASLVCFASAAGNLAPLTNSIYAPDNSFWYPNKNLKNSIANPNSVWFAITDGEKEMVHVYGSNGDGNEFFKCPAVPKDFLTDNCHEGVEASQETMMYVYQSGGSAHCTLNYQIAPYTQEYLNDWKEDLEKRAREAEEALEKARDEMDSMMDPMMDPMRDQYMAEAEAEAETDQNNYSEEPVTDPDEFVELMRDPMKKHRKDQMKDPMKDPVMEPIIIMQDGFIQVPEVTAPPESGFNCSRGFRQTLKTFDTDFQSRDFLCSVKKNNRHVRLTPEVSESGLTPEVSEPTLPSTGFLGSKQNANDRHKNIASVNDSLANSYPSKSVWFSITGGDKEMFHAYGANANGSAYFECPRVMPINYSGGHYFGGSCGPEDIKTEIITYEYGVSRGSAYCRVHYNVDFNDIPQLMCPTVRQSFITEEDEIATDVSNYPLCAVKEPHVRVFLGDPWL